MPGVGGIEQGEQVVRARLLALLPLHFRLDMREQIDPNVAALGGVSEEGRQSVAIEVVGRGLHGLAPDSILCHVLIEQPARAVEPLFDPLSPQVTPLDVASDPG